jgi:outer membrane protein OmpA-like peptidoglycan-associated protein
MKLAHALVCVLLFSPLMTIEVKAQEDADVSDLITKLKPKPGLAGKKSIKINAADIEAKTLNLTSIEEKTKKKAPSSSAGSSPIAPELLNLPSAELAINFASNSSTVLPKSVVSLAKLALALNNEALQSSKFLVAGHTDSKGSNGLNQALSKRRADAVRKILTEDFDVQASRIVSIGFGEEQLKNSDEPENAENRRVEIINIGVN